MEETYYLVFKGFYKYKSKTNVVFNLEIVYDSSERLWWLNK